MDVNERIINEWLHLCKNQFTITNIPFKVTGPKGGVNYSNIDILAVDKEGNYYDYEIKWRSIASMGATKNETIESFAKQMTRKERIEKIKEIIGDRAYKKIFITTKIGFGKTEKTRKKYEKELKNNRIDEVLYFEDIIQKLSEKVNIKGRYDSQILQIIRMLKQLNIKLDK